MSTTGNVYTMEVNMPLQEQLNKHMPSTPIFADQPVFVPLDDSVYDAAMHGAKRKRHPRGVVVGVYENLENYRLIGFCKDSASTMPGTPTRVSVIVSGTVSIKIQGKPRPGDMIIAQDYSKRSSAPSFRLTNTVDMPAANFVVAPASTRDYDMQFASLVSGGRATDINNYINAVTNFKNVYEANGGQTAFRTDEQKVAKIYAAARAVDAANAKAKMNYRNLVVGTFVKESNGFHDVVLKNF